MRTQNITFGATVEIVKLDKTKRVVPVSTDETEVLSPLTESLARQPKGAHSIVIEETNLGHSILRLHSKEGVIKNQSEKNFNDGKITLPKLVEQLMAQAEERQNLTLDPKSRPISMPTQKAKGLLGFLRKFV